MTIRERIDAVWQRIAARMRVLWSRLLNMNVPIARGYLVVCLMVLLLFALGLGAVHLVERRLVAAIRQHPTDSEAYDDLLHFYVELGSLRRYKIMLQRLAAEFPESPWPWEELAWLDHYSIPAQYTLSREGMSAAEHVEGSVFDENDVEALLSLARLYYAVGEHDLAHNTAQKALGITPDSSEAHFWSGQALKQMGELEYAERQFEAGSRARSEDERYSSLSYAELLPATREMTITLHADHMLVQTRAELDAGPEEVPDYFTTGPPDRLRELAWGYTWIDPWWRLAQVDQPMAMEIDGSHLIVSDEGLRIDYNKLWFGSYRPDEYPMVSVEALPLSAYQMPTTITVISEGTKVYSTTHPYRTVNNGTSWEFAGIKSPVRPLGFTVEPDEFSRLKLVLSTNFALQRLSYRVLWASATVIGVVVFVKIRYNARGTDYFRDIHNGRNLEAIVHHALRPSSVFSWVFDVSLIALGGFTVLINLWLRIQDYPYWLPIMLFAYVLVLGLLLARLVFSPWHISRRQDSNLVLIGALVFIFYLVPRSSVYNELGLAYLVINAVAYYLLLMRNRHWPSKLDWTRLKNLYSPRREAFIEQIMSVNLLPRLETAIRSQDLALADGKIKVAEYKESQEILNRSIQDKQDELIQLRRRLGIPEDEAPKDVLFKLGPAATPLRSGLVALAFGLIPYFIFIFLASWAGQVSIGYREEFGVFELYELVSDLIAMSWGPIYLLFFGLFFRFIWGNSGATKGLLFGGVLAALNALFTWLWLWNQVDLVQLWGTTVRVLVTFVFTGVMMDWKTVGFSWGRIGHLYDSPVFTSIIAVVGTALTTLVAGLATGTMDRLLSVALQGILAALGTQPPPVP